MKLSEIEEKLNRNEWILPSFQREFVWDKEQKIIEFIESVFYEWPIGAIILWKPDPNDETIIKKRNLQISSVGKPQYPQEYIIDGQQRITTLLKILNNEPFIFRDVKHQMFYDFSSKKFVFMEANYLQENTISERERTLRKIKTDYRHKTSRSVKNGVVYEYTYWLKKKADDGFKSMGKEEPDWNEIIKQEYDMPIEQKDYDNNRILVRDIIKLKHSEIKDILKQKNFNYNIDDLIDGIKNIRDYDITIQRPNKPISLEDALELFIRLNIGGKQLSSEDLALGYISLLWEDSRDEFKKFKEQLNTKGFDFDFDFFVRCLSAVSLNQSLTQKLIRSFKTETIKKDWELTKNGIEKTIDFLKTMKLNSNNLLEVENYLIPIVLIFSKKEGAVKNKMNLFYWFLISYINQRFSNQSVSILNRDIKTILEFSDPIDELIKNLEDERSIFITTPKDIKGNQFKFVLYCLFKDLNTCDLVSNFGIEGSPSSKSNQLDFHHIFADSILKNSNFKGKKEDIANKTFLTNESNKKLSDSYPTYLSEYTKKSLKEHFIPTDDRLYKLEKYEEFLEERKKLISEGLNKYLNELKTSTV